MKDIIFQISTLNMMTTGAYDGACTVEELVKYGNTGLGLFDAANGELIIDEGVCYQADRDCQAVPAGKSSKVPFAALGFTEGKQAFQLETTCSYSNFAEAMDAKFQPEGLNYFYLFKAEAQFETVSFRSFSKQTKPYPSFDEVLSNDEKIVTLQDAQGSLVGLFTPEFFDGINSAGWHLHFLSADKKFGGHVHDFTSSKLDFFCECKHKFSALLPETESFKLAKY